MHLAEIYLRLTTVRLGPLLLDFLIIWSQVRQQLASDLCWGTALLQVEVASPGVVRSNMSSSKDHSQMQGPIKWGTCCVLPPGLLTGCCMQAPQQLEHYRTRRETC
jgi:hypothetical protein